MTAVRGRRGSVGPLLERRSKNSSSTSPGTRSS